MMDRRAVFAKTASVAFLATITPLHACRATEANHDDIAKAYLAWLKEEAAFVEKALRG